ncbi:TD1 [Scenedesmus sp. PABB004]|nr:TD1 [Scenedesmus sp. PABB004]
MRLGAPRCPGGGPTSAGAVLGRRPWPAARCSGPRAVQQQRQQWRSSLAPPGAASVSSQPASPAEGVEGVPLVSTGSLSSFEEPFTAVPEDLTLPPGVLSKVDRASPLAPEDVFRCAGCTKAECQVRTGGGTASAGAAGGGGAPARGAGRRAAAPAAPAAPAPRRAPQGPQGCAATPWRLSVDGYLREILTARVYDVAVQSPLERAEKLSEALGNNLLLKREDLQPVFSFKLRGAFNKMAKLPAEALQRGVITSSAGNHAQGVALAASKLGCTAIICMPENTPDIKVANVRRLGGVVELVGESYQEAQAHAQARALAEGLTFVAPYDDPLTIAGQGTIGDEILRQFGDPAALDAIFIIGVQPTGANTMAMSLEQGRRVTLSRVDAFADGVAVKFVGAETFRLCREHVEGVVLVDNASTSAAIKDVYNETRSILEPAGAVAVAGAKAWLRENGHKVRARGACDACGARRAPAAAARPARDARARRAAAPQGKTVVAVTSGANINFERLRLVSELADVGARTEVMMATTIPERPGAFKAFVAASFAGRDLNVTEFKYRYSAGSSANILWSVGVRDKAEIGEIIARLADADMPTLDISHMESAQIHLRHLVGGRARSYTGEIPHERIYRVQFPERVGALSRFLEALSCGAGDAPLNVTLFHYRNTGNRESYVMLGLQVPPEADRAWRRGVKALQDEFTFEELVGDERRIGLDLLHARRDRAPARAAAALTRRAMASRRALAAWLALAVAHAGLAAAQDGLLLSRNEDDCIAPALAGLNSPPRVYPTSRYMISGTQTYRDTDGGTVIKNNAGFSVKYFATYKVVTNLPAGETYVLYHCGTPPPASVPAGAKVFEIPLRSVSTDDTSAADFLKQVSAIDRVAYASQLSVSGCFQSMAGCGYVAPDPQYAAEDAAAIASQVDAFVTTGATSNPKSIAISAVFASAPLLRAEWLKYMAAFVNKEWEAETLYRTIRNDYNALRRAAGAAAGAAGRRTVVAWVYLGWAADFVVSKAPYKAAYVADAGGAMLDDATLRAAGMTAQGGGSWSMPQANRAAWAALLAKARARAGAPAAPRAPRASRPRARAPVGSTRARCRAQADVIIDETYDKPTGGLVRLADFVSRHGLSGRTVPAVSGRRVYTLAGTTGQTVQDPDSPYDGSVGLDWYERGTSHCEEVLRDFTQVLTPSTVHRTLAGWKLRWLLRLDGVQTQFRTPRDCGSESVFDSACRRAAYPVPICPNIVRNCTDGSWTYPVQAFRCDAVRAQKVVRRLRKRQGLPECVVV